MAQWSSQPGSVQVCNGPWCIFNRIQHRCYKLHSHWAVYSLSVAGLSVQTASIIRTIAQSCSVSDTATNDNEGRSTPVSPFSNPSLNTLKLSHISPQLPSSYSKYLIIHSQAQTSCTQRSWLSPLDKNVLCDWEKDCRANLGFYLSNKYHSTIRLGHSRAQLHFPSDMICREQRRMGPSSDSEVNNRMFNSFSSV